MPTLTYFIAMPLAAAFLTPLFAKRMKRAADAIACVSTLSLFALSCGIAVFVINHKTASYDVGNWVPPFGIELVVDAFSAFMLVVANMIGFFVALYSVGYIKTYTDKWKYYTLFMLMMAGVNGLLITSDIFNMFVFLEIASISAYALVAFGTEPRSLEASFKYAVMGAVASSFILLGIAFLYGFASTVNMNDLAQVIASKGQVKLLSFVSILFLMGFGLKAAAVPFHAWLPDAYSSSPATIPAVSSGVLIKTLGVYAIVRIFFNIFGATAAVSSVLIILAVLSMLVGAFLAFGQTNIRRLFGYSSISQVGYILLGFGIGTPLAIAGSLLHLFNHSVAKSSLFLNSGIAENAMHSNDLTRLSGILKKRPVSGYSMLAGAFSICGVPPFGGFWSKLMIILACVHAGRPGLASIAVFASILTLAYYIKALTPAIFGKENTEPMTQHEIKPNAAMNIAVIALTVIVILGGLALLPGPANNLLNNAAAIIVKGTSFANIGGLR
ncbi:MAG: proton-conducting transporter membrane subunit [Candidatus Omnitrophica bacterium]|nr:proton-conducting transporter membrane subunit [Candidatus Omnitrophota bacterium]